MTGAFWDVTNPAKPVGPFDPDSQLDIPFDWSDWISDKSATYSTHEFVTDSDLTVVSSAHAAGVITALVKVTDDATPALGSKLFVTCRITATAGGLTLIDDRTVYLKITER